MTEAAASTEDPIVKLPPDLVMHDEEVAQFSAETWHLPRARWRPIRRKATGKGVRVAVNDTGIVDHPVLARPVSARSFIRGESVRDGNAHGTHCSGTVLSRDEDIGVAPDADLIIGKCLSNGGSGSSSGIAASINWAVDVGADVVSLSLGGPSAYQPTIDAIKRAFSRGVICVIAAGNSGFNGSRNTIGWPARSAEGICVAALASNGRPANFSSGGSQMTIAAPGQSILSTSNNGTGFRLMSGTSMATPFVAGCFALIIEAMRRKGNPSWTAVESVNAFVRAHAKDLGTPGHDPSTGFGQFDMTEVVEKLTTDDLKFA